MIRKPISFPVRVTLHVVSVAVIFAGYVLLAHRQYVVNPKNTTMPRLSQFQKGWEKVTASEDRESWLFEDLKATYGRLFRGLAVGVAISLVVGIGMGCFPAMEAFFGPPLTFFARIPPTAMLAVYFVVFGTEMKLFVAMIALGIFPTLAQSIFQAAKKDVTDHAIYKAYTLGASNAEVIWNVVFRQVLPRILESVRLHVGPAMVFLIAAEWVVADAGFGYRLRIQSRLLEMSVVYIYLIVLGITGLLLDWLLAVVRRKLCPWFGE